MKKSINERIHDLRERSGIKRDEQGIDYNHNQWFFVAVRIK